MKYNPFLICRDHYKKIIKLINNGEMTSQFDLNNLRIHIPGCEKCKEIINETGRAILEGRNE